MNTTSKQISDLVFAIAMAEDQAQAAEDREQYGRANKIKAQVRAMKSELAALESAEVAQ